MKYLKRVMAGVCAVGLLSVPAVISAQDGEWGLSGFGKGDGTRPTGNKSPEYMSNFGAYYLGGGGDKAIYLTFDCGYENGNTAKILDVLKKENVPAAFFVVGTYIRDDADLVKRMAAEGHIVGNHTMRHPDVRNISTEKFLEQLRLTADLYKEKTGRDMPKFYRPPQGKYDERTMKAAYEAGYKTFFWSLAYMDFDPENQPSRETAFGKLLTRIHPGAVVLLHNTSETNADILEELIQKYRDMGYEFKSLYDFKI